MNKTQIRKLRKQLGMTQEQFAEKLGVSFATLNRWENSHTTPSNMAIIQLEKLRDEAKRQNNGLGAVQVP